MSESVINDSCCSEIACLIAAFAATKEEKDWLIVIEAEVIEAEVKAEAIKVNAITVAMISKVVPANGSISKAKRAKCAKDFSVHNQRASS